jgi:adenine-specific DNA-methyltransferase
VQLRLPGEAREAKGVVYTKPWVVDLILDLVGYRVDADLATMIAVEPAAGEGAFLIPMVRRLLASLQLHGRSIEEAKRALLAYELDGQASAWARQLVVKELMDAGIPRREADCTAAGWIFEGDYLLSSASAPRADVIVGNPPYIRYDDLPEDLLRSYRTVCRTMIGRFDIYVGFIEAGIGQLKVGGRLGFICADRWMRSAYGAELRRFIAENASVEAVIEMHDAPAFDEEVAAYPAVTVIRRGEQGPSLVASAGANSGSANGEENVAEAIVELADKRRRMLPGFRAAKLPGWYSGDSPWPWAEPEQLALIRRLEAECRPLEDTQTGTRVGIGVATGADKVFITTDTAVAEPDRLLPLAMAQDTKSGSVGWSGHYLVNPWGPDGNLVDLSDHPKLAAYFEAHSSALRRRNVAGRSPARWYRTIDRVNQSLLKRNKLYFPDMKLQANPVLDRGETYPHHNLYFIISAAWDLEVLGGLLLSEIAELFVASYCVKMRGGTLRFQAQYLRRIRVPALDTLNENVRVRLRDAFRHRDRQAATAAAYEAYGINMATNTY